MRTVIAFTLVACTHQYSVEDYYRDLGALHCQRMTECCTAAEYQDWWTSDSTGDMYSCLQSWQQPPELSAIQAALDRGTIEFDIAAAHACVQALQGVACSDFEPAYRYRETYCESPLHGLITAGGTCHTDRECASSWCAMDPSTPGTGLCNAVRIAEGATCTGTSEPAGCEAPDGCQGGTCGIGAAAGAECSNDWQCADHWCKGAGFLTSGHCIKACDGK